MQVLHKKKLEYRRNLLSQNALNFSYGREETEISCNEYKGVLGFIFTLL